MAGPLRTAAAEWAADMIVAFPSFPAPRDHITPEALTQLVFETAGRAPLPSDRSSDMSRIVTLHGSNHTQPDTSTPWQRERTQPPLTPIGEEFTGRRKVWSWMAVAAVAAPLWTAVFAWALS